METRKIILLVEDNVQDEQLTLRALDKNGIRHEVIVCRDGDEALDWLFRRGPHADREANLVPDVILLDLKLPKLNGHEVLTAIRKCADTRRIPVVVLSTSKEQADIEASYDCGANRFIQKPVSFSEFSRAIREFGIYWLQINETALRALTPRGL